jgi:hypothetical protein
MVADEGSSTEGAYLGYEDGGYLPPGVRWVRNETGAPERVWTPEELERRSND